MGELDGVWKVERLSGALPPMLGVRKIVRGARGVTRAGPVRARFDVDGLTLRYRPPFAGVVDVLEPDGAGGFAGVSTFRGRTIGRFALRPIRQDATEEERMTTAADELVKYIDEAYALEQNVLRMLDSLIGTTDDPGLVDAFEAHREETRRHAELMEERLRAHDAGPSVVKEIGGIVGALAKLPWDVVRGEKAARNARDAFATEHLEIASYELLRRVAERAGDQETAAAARQIIEDERRMAQRIEESWDAVAEQALRDEGIIVPG